MHIATPQLIILIVLSVCFVFGIPLKFMLDLNSNKKKADGGHIRLLKINRSGTFLSDDIVKLDREIVTDDKKTPANPEGKPITYLAPEGYVPSSVWPPYQNRFTQVTIPTVISVDGIMEPPDVLGQYRSLDKVKSVSSSHMVSHIRAEKATEAAMKEVDLIRDLTEQLEKALLRAGRNQLMTIIVGAATIIALIVVAVILNSKMSHMNTTLTQLVGNLTAILPSTPVS